MKKILLIGTGGTIASEVTDDGLAPELTTEQLLAHLPAVSGLCDVSCIQLLNLDSTNMGLATPTQGSVVWNGEDVTSLGITERAQRGISYGFQQPPRFKGLTVRDLLTISSGDENFSKDRCCQCLTKVGLCANDYLDREVDASLSGGEVKRIEIATILARNASLMIFDEPEAGIDLWSFARLTETFEQIHRNGSATMVIISHQERIISLADEVVVVGGGSIQHRGAPEEILPKILSDTTGSCPMLRKEGDRK